MAFPGGDEHDTKIRATAGFLWRTTSGHAHSPTKLTVISVKDAVRKPDGSVTAKPELSIDCITVALFNATLVTSEAWRLCDLRCQPVARFCVNDGRKTYGPENDSPNQTFGTDGWTSQRWDISYPTGSNRVRKPAGTAQGTTPRHPRRISGR
jgi:hypothetical protein